MKKFFFMSLIFLAGNIVSYAQEDNGGISERKMTQKVYPQGMDNYFFGVFYYNGKDVYTPMGNIVCRGDSIDDLKINPSYSSFATLERSKKGATRVSIYDAQKADWLIKRIKSETSNETAITYSYDAKQLAIASSDKSITIYNPINNIVIKTFTSSLVPSKMQYSDNNFFLAVGDGSKLEIWNLERGTVRTTLTFDGMVNDFIFDAGSGNLLVLTSNGKLQMYDTTSFNLKTTIDDLGNAIACWPNNNGKYVAVLNNDKRVCVVNVLDPTERHFFEDVDGKISGIRVVYNTVDDESYLVYNNANAIIYKRIEGLKPYYKKMLTTMLDEQMEQWLKQMPGETLEAYELRVNEETRAEQAKALERDLATKMATGLIQQSEVTIGGYDTNTQSVVMHLGNMPDILLSVPSDDLNSFGATNKLEFRNVKYGLMPNDRFELVYAEVYNPENGKTYIYNNMNRTSLSAMQDDLLSLDIIRKTKMEETRLEGIKEETLNQARQEQVLSDNTHIFVKTGAVNAVNADGKRIINYNVEFTYEVEEEFSARDDFKPGRYHTDESPAAMQMLKIMKKAFETDFAKYLVNGKRVKIQVKGTADASPIRRPLVYDERYGEYVNEPVYKNGELNNITLNKKEGIADNEQLAFARAIGVQNYIEKDLPDLNTMNKEYEYHIEVSKETGSQYRRISIQYTFIDASFEM